MVTWCIMASTTASKVYVYLYLPRELTDWLKENAVRERRSFNNYVSLILEDYYEKQSGRVLRCMQGQ